MITIAKIYLLVIYWVLRKAANRECITFLCATFIFGCLSRQLASLLSSVM